MARLVRLGRTEEKTRLGKTGGFSGSSHRPWVSFSRGEIICRAANDNPLVVPQAARKAKVALGFASTWPRYEGREGQKSDPIPLGGLRLLAAIA